VASAGYIAHRREAPASVGIAVVTVSDTRIEATDESGRYLRAAAAAAGHRAAFHRIVKDDPPAVRAALEAALADPAVDVVVTTGGTGIAGRDGTVEVVAAMIEKRLDGFGEIFRVLSFEDVGPPAILSRALAGTVGRKAIFALPGSLAAVRLAWEKILGPEVAHVVRELRKDRG
jgi:molybdenum cofactor biosynthesis protein B